MRHTKNCHAWYFFFQAADKTLIFVYNLKRICWSRCSWGLFSAALCKQIEAIPATCHTPSGRQGRERVLKGCWVYPWLRWWGFLCFWMPLCIGEGGCWMMLKARIPEEVKHSEHQVGLCPGRLENPINPD